MDLKLFSPSSKIQKDRETTSAIDREMATFGWNSVLVTLTAFLPYSIFGSLVQIYPIITVALGVGLSLVALLMGYFALNYKNLYPRGAARWRNRYSLVAILHGVWISVFLCTVIVAVGVTTESLAAWVCFASYAVMSIGVYSAYLRFNLVFSGVMLLPASFFMLAQMTIESTMAAIITFAIWSSLSVQSNRFCKNYWASRTANFLLTQKMNTVATPHKTDNSAINLDYEFLGSLGQELKAALNDILGGLTLLRDTTLSEKQTRYIDITEKGSEKQLELVENVIDLSRISRKSLAIESNNFNLRKELEDTFETLTKEAHEYNVEVNYVIQEDLPYRAKGDKKRLRQVISGLINNMIHSSKAGELFVAVSFEETNTLEELILNIFDEGKQESRQQSMPTKSVQGPKTIKAGAGLGLAICEGITECLGGRIGSNNKQSSENNYWLRIPLSFQKNHSHYFVPNIKLAQKRVLVVGAPNRIAGHLCRELESWGLLVSTASEYSKIPTVLSEAIDNKEEFDALLGFTKLSDVAVIGSFTSSSENPKFRSLQQFIVASELQFERDTWSSGMNRHSNIHPIKKPLNYRLFHEVLVRTLLHLNFPPKQHMAEDSWARSNSSGKILLVEDHRVNQMVAEGMLKKLGYRPSIAKNGDEALELIAKETFDLVLMDCQMAGMDGYEATQHIRSKEQSEDDEAHIPIIALTGQTAEEDQSRCLAAGMDDYIAKPVTYDDLECRLRRWLGDEPNRQHH